MEPTEPEDSDEDKRKTHYAIGKLLMEFKVRDQTWYAVSFKGEDDKYNTIWTEKKVQWHAKQSGTEDVFAEWLVSREKFVSCESAKGIKLEGKSRRLPGAAVIGKGGAVLGVLAGKSLVKWIPEETESKPKSVKKRKPVKKKAQVEKTKAVVSVEIMPSMPSMSGVSLGPAQTNAAGTGESSGDPEIEKTHIGTADKEEKETGGGVDRAEPVGVFNANASSRLGLKKKEGTNAADRGESSGDPETEDIRIGKASKEEKETEGGVDRAAPLGVFHANASSRLRLKKKEGTSKKQKKWRKASRGSESSPSGGKKDALSIAFPMLYALHSDGKVLGESRLTKSRGDLVSLIAVTAITRNNEQTEDYVHFRGVCSRKMQNIRSLFGVEMDELVKHIETSAKELTADTPDLALKMVESICGDKKTESPWLTPHRVLKAFSFLQKQVVTVRQVQLIVLHVAVRLSWRKLELDTVARNSRVTLLNKVHLLRQEAAGNMVASTDTDASGMLAGLFAPKSKEIVAAVKRLLSEWALSGVPVELESKSSKLAAEVKRAKIEQKSGEQGQVQGAGIESRAPSPVTPKQLQSPMGESTSDSEFSTPSQVKSANTSTHASMHTREHATESVTHTHTTVR